MEPTNEQAQTQAVEQNAPQTNPAQNVQDNSEPQPKTFTEDYVKALRDEAASYRTKARDLEVKLKDAKTPDDVNKLVADYSQQLHQRDVEIVALQYNIPEALRSRLQGETIEDLRKDAEAIAALFQPQQTPPPKLRQGQPSGGLDPNSRDDGKLDPVALAREVSKRSKGF